MAQSEPTACSIEKADGRSRADIQGLHRPADWNPIAFVGQPRAPSRKAPDLQPPSASRSVPRRYSQAPQKVDAASGIGRKESSAIVRPEFFYRDAFGQIHRKVRAHPCAARAASTNQRSPDPQQQPARPRQLPYGSAFRHCRHPERRQGRGASAAAHFSGAGAAGSAISHMTPTPFSTGEMAS